MDAPVLIERDLSYRIVGAFFEVHNALGFGFLESIYAAALQLALKERGILVEREVRIPVTFHAQQIGLQRLDMLVERRVIIEIKSTEKLSDIAKRQLRNYLVAANLELGLLLHFGPRAEPHRILARKRI